jgi:hypothetical protein
LELTEKALCFIKNFAVRKYTDLFIVESLPIMLFSFKRTLWFSRIFLALAPNFGDLLVSFFSLGI